MPKENAIIAQDGNLLTITFPTFSITIPTENAILWNGEPLPHSLNLDSCADGFEFHDTEDKFVLGYKAHRRSEVGALEAAAEIDESNIQGPTVNRQVDDAEFARAKDQQHDRRAVNPRTPARSTSQATIFHSPPFKTPPQPAKSTRSFSATASTSSAPSPRTIIPITPPEGTTHKLREVPLRNSAQKAMSASERYADLTSTTSIIPSISSSNSPSNITKPQHLPRSHSFTTPRRRSNNLITTPHTPTMPRRASTSAPSLQFRSHPYKPPSSHSRRRNIASSDNGQTTPIFHGPWYQGQLTTKWRGTANLYSRTKEEDIQDTGKENRIPSVGKRFERSRTPSPSPTRGRRGINMREVKGGRTGMANYGRTGEFGRPRFDTKEGGGPDNSPFGDADGEHDVSTEAFRPKDQRSHRRGETAVDQGIEITRFHPKAALPTPSHRPSFTPATSAPTPSASPTNASSVKTSKPHYESPSKAPHRSPSSNFSFHPSTNTSIKSTPTAPLRSTDLDHKPFSQRSLQLSSSPCIQQSKRPLQLSPSLPADLSKYTSSSSATGISVMKRRRSNATVSDVEKRDSGKNEDEK
ncbi:MAG: hypothetical protein LQ337_005863 [Flavoplaca oasis]|nr:MAG: hypothetical protein LQ337_005863 [Flavoplaca oasis]